MIHEAMMPSNFTSSGGSDYQNGTWNNPFWAVIIFVIFVVIIALFWRRDDHKGNYGIDGVLPALALNKFGKEDGCCCEHRDLLLESGNIKKEIALVGWQQDKTALENRNLVTLGFKENEILGLKSTSEIMNRICTLENNLREDKLRATELKLNNLETIIGIRGLGAVPSYYSAHPPYPCTPQGAYA